MKTEGGCFTAMLKILGVVFVVWVIWMHYSARATPCGYNYWRTLNCAEEEGELAEFENLRAAGLPVPDRYWQLKEQKRDVILEGRHW